MRVIGAYDQNLRAYHGDPAVKVTYLNRVTLHAAQDEIVQGFYWERGKGCAVGCTIHGSDHQAYESELGIPMILARLEDRLFERMAVAGAKKWPLQFLGAIPVGADLSLVWPRYAVWMLNDPTDGVIRFASERTRDSIGRVVALYERVLGGEDVPREEFVKLREFTYPAWRAAADVAAAAAAAADVAAAADDAADAADVAADAADAAVAAAAAAAAAADVDTVRTARRAYAARAGAKLLELLASAPATPPQSPTP